MYIQIKLEEISSSFPLNLVLEAKRWVVYSSVSLDVYGNGNGFTMQNAWFLWCPWNLQVIIYFFWPDLEFFHLDLNKVNNPKKKNSLEARHVPGEQPCAHTLWEGPRWSSTSRCSCSANSSCQWTYERNASSPQWWTSLSRKLPKFLWILFDHIVDVVKLRRVFLLCLFNRRRFSHQCNNTNNLLLLKWLHRSLIKPRLLVHRDPWFVRLFLRSAVKVHWKAYSFISSRRRQCNHPLLMLDVRSSKLRVRSRYLWRRHLRYMPDVFYTRKHILGRWTSFLLSTI